MVKEIKHYPNYIVTSEGKVVNILTNKVKKPWLCKNGYYYINLQYKNRKTKLPLHRLLAMLFIPNYENKKTVNHKDGNKLNNSLNNLEWATYRENIQHAYDNNLNSQKYRLKINEEYANYLFITKIMKGTSLTKVAKELGIGLTQLSYRIKEAAKRLNMENEYAEELKKQKLLRSKAR